MAKKPITTAKPLIPQLVSIAPVIKKAEISDLRLISCRASLGNLPDELNQHLNVQGTLNEVEKSLRVVIRLALSGNPPGPDGSPIETNEDFYVEARFGITYLLESLDGITPELAGAFANQNGIFNVWPFWREFVHSTTTRMAVPALMVPLLKSPPLLGKPAATISQSEKPTPIRSKKRRK